LEVAAADPNSDGLLVILTPQAMTESTKTAEALVPYAHSTGKPVLASWMGGQNVEQGLQLLGKAGIPTFEYPDVATRVFAYMWKSAYNLQGIYETPSMSETIAPDRAKAEQMLEAVRESGRTILTEVESKQLLAAYGLPIVETVIARTEAEAVTAAELDAVAAAECEVADGHAALADEPDAAERRVGQQAGDGSRAALLGEIDLLERMVGTHQRQQRRQIVGAGRGQGHRGRVR
jgi:acyl-CoA synthetase (NDP forming)